jgi:hypothetical protein
MKMENKNEFMKTKIALMCQFMAGFLSVFGLANIIKSNIKHFDQSKDSEKLSRDWKNIGGDITKSYEQFKSECCK